MQDCERVINEIATKRYELKFIVSLKKEIEEVYKTFLKAIEDEMSQAIYTIECYEKKISYFIETNAHNYQLPIPIGFCDEFCLKCNNKGLYFINNAKYHKACSNCPALLENIEICIHCQSKVNYNFYEPLNLCKGCKMSPQTNVGICKKSHCFNCYYFCEKCNDIHCKACAKENKTDFNSNIKMHKCKDLLQAQIKKYKAFLKLKKTEWKSSD
ncbi:hypothetical protein SteCoe_1072 [Stentor coeruleus]|uniref:Uncharacterized protein n=1 Tax=Stentor coeruleus TaxID=5963 RepID=A0A1R2D2P1_9CILI|nr:hypothetical protein SteCoe_1072 [Stentor coeruleus]